MLLGVCGTHKLEGIVSKRADRPYVSGKTKDWIKVKCPNWREQNSWRHEFFSKQRGHSRAVRARSHAGLVAVLLCALAKSYRRAAL